MEKIIFWGFAIVVLNVPEIFDSVHLDSFENMGYEYQLWRIDPDNNKKTDYFEIRS